MNAKILSFIILAIIVIGSVCGCSKEKDYNPDDYNTSLLTGEYGKGQLWDLNVLLNDEPVNDYGYVRFESKDLKVADFRFVKVIPGESEKEFKKVPLTDTEEGMGFTIEYTKGKTPIVIKGVVDFGVMTVNIKM